MPGFVGAGAKRIERWWHCICLSALSFEHLLAVPRTKHFGGSPRCRDECRDLVSILHARGTFDSGGNVDTWRAGLGKRARHVASIEATREEPGLFGFDHAKQAPAEPSPAASVSSAEGR